MRRWNGSLLRFGISFLLLSWLSLVGACSGCTRPNPDYCDELADCENGTFCNLETHACEANPPDADLRCTTDDQCREPMKPICGDDQACRACALDDECASGVCREDGACEAGEAVLHVAPNGISAGECAAEAPCDFYYALGLVDGSRYSLRLANGTYSFGTDLLVTSPITKLVIVGGRSAILQRSGAGALVQIRSAEVTIRGPTLTRGVDCDTGGIRLQRVAFSTPGSEIRPWLQASNCEILISGSDLVGSRSSAVRAQSGGNLVIEDTRIEGSAENGVYATGVGKVTIARSVLLNNAKLALDAAAQRTTVSRCLVHMNDGGGIRSVGGVFDVINNFVTANGNDIDGAFGGLLLDSATVGNRFEHNTVVRNDSQPNHEPLYAGGVYCRGTGSFQNNIIVSNYAGNAQASNAQTNGTCSFGYSRIFPDDAERFNGSLDKPMLTSTSPAIDQGSATEPPVTDDYEGQVRAGAPDIGADEFYP